MKVYEVGRSNNKIVIREAIRETEQFFVFQLPEIAKTWREMKITNDYRLFPSWKEARDYIIHREKEKIGAAKLMLEEAEEWFEMALNIPETEPGV